MMRLATISPCYNEEEVLENSVARLTTLFNDLIQQGHISADSMMVFVNDGSKDHVRGVVRCMYLPGIKAGFREELYR